jgi:hypothetical protein
MKNCNTYPSHHVIKAAEEVRVYYLSNDKILIQKCLVKVDLHALRIKQLQELSWLKKIHKFVYRQYFETIASHFKTGLRWKHWTQRIQATVIGRC